MGQGRPPEVLGLSRGDVGVDIPHHGITISGGLLDAGLLIRIDLDLQKLFTLSASSLLLTEILQQL